VTNVFLKFLGSNYQKRKEEREKWRIQYHYQEIRSQEAASFSVIYTTTQ
jgi:hypothetical protein